jgi:superfamily II DNA or RNA helicase
VLVHRSTSASQVALSTVGPGDGELLAAMAAEVRTGGECFGVSLAAVLTPEALQRLAGATSFGRGERYASDGAVLATAEDDDGALIGEVRGAGIYRVRLWVQDARLAFSCTCPVGAARSFCKHCVAVGLIWLAGEDDSGARAPAAPAMMASADPVHPGGSSQPLRASSKELLERLERAEQQLARLRADNERLRVLLGQPSPAAPPPEEPAVPTLFPTHEPVSPIDSSASPKEKVALVRALFRGQEEVYAVRWTNSRTGKVGYAPAVAGASRGAPGGSKRHMPLTDEVVQEHLLGTKTIGVYPLLKDDTCWFLACDFDGGSWALDAVAFLDACSRHGVPAALERSRSGDGGHVWVFFTSPVPAVAARRLGTALLRETMVMRAEMDLASYDRFFPSQDVLPRGSFGNLIALPLQGKSRTSGNTEFCDPATLQPWPDQWAFLSRMQRMSPPALEALCESLLPVRVGPELAATAVEPMPGERPPPPRIDCRVGAMLSLEKAGLPPSLLASVKHLASLHNPTFYERQKLRLSTYQTPRFIKCYQEDLSHLYLPRGVLEQLRSLLGHAGSDLVVTDHRPSLAPLSLRFHGRLTALQATAVDTMLGHDHGVLVAPPGTGKTVMGAAIIAARNLPTLVLVHRKPLLDQWRVQLVETLGLSSNQVGQIGGGKNKPTGMVDLAMIQSLSRLDNPEGLFQRYGAVVIDECHHLPAFSFESCVRRAPARHVLGLTATPYRRDGLQGIITMQCGPIRHTISPRDAEPDAPRPHLRVRATDFGLEESDDASIQEVFRALVNDQQRTALVCEDVLAALSQRRRCLVLSQWKDHVHLIAEQLRANGKEPLVLEGGLSKKAREAILADVQHSPADQDLVLVATGQYLGEGFDCPQLDTLFLAFPVAFKGKLVQYTGRLLRPYPGKRTATVYDYADSDVPVLAAMHAKRLRTYRSLGFADVAVEP